MTANQSGNSSVTINVPTIPSVNNATITLAAGTGMTGGGAFTLNQSSNETITFNSTGGGIGGSGTNDFVPLFNGTTSVDDSIMQQTTSGSSKKIVVNGRMDLTGNGGDANGGTLKLTSSSARLGIATSAISGGEPEASLDVGKNARVRGSLNVGATSEQYLFVSSAQDTPIGYVRMGYYGGGTDYDLSGDAAQATQYTTAFSNGGKICEDERIMTFKFSRSVFANIDSTGKELIAADSNFTYIVKEAYLFSSPDGGGSAPTLGSGDFFNIEYQTITSGGTKNTKAFKVGDSTFNQSNGARRIIGFEPIQYVAIGAASAVPRSSVRITSTGLASSGTGTCNIFLRMRVKNIDFADDISNNPQLITIT
tara:strand:- start:577 stop:1674 length:1098 start_codon:yes stop_codon:yes gene_type:complete